MTVFEKAYKLLVKNEGLYDSPEDTAKNGDTGGETIIGISRNNFPGLDLWKVVDAWKAAGKNPIDLAKDPEFVSKYIMPFYKSEFWDRMSLDFISTKSIVIALKMFDAAEKVYWKTEAVLLQRALNIFNMRGKYWADIGVDGVISPGGETIAAFNKAIDQGYEAVLVTTINALQIARYVDITEKNQTYENFALGWIKWRGQDPYKVLDEFNKLS
jgi:lysozyme family protein